MNRKKIDDMSVFLGVELSLGNSISRFIINRLAEKKNGSNLLEESLLDYCGTGSASLLQKIKISPLVALLELSTRTFNVDKKIMQEFFSDTVTRRGFINVMRSIGKYGITRPLKLAAPFLVVWNYTNACNLRCKHCYQNASTPLPDELHTDEKMNVIDQLAESGVMALAFSGGEPLLSPDFFEVASYASKKDMFVSLATNGTFLSKKMVDRIVDSGVKYIEISLDAVTPEIHDSFRGARGSWERTIEGIRNASERKELFICVASTISKDNYGEVNGLIDLADELGARRFIAFNFIPTGNALNIIDADPTPAMREELLQTLYRRLSDSRIEVMTTAPQFARVCMSRSKDIIAVAHFGTGKTGDKTRMLAEFIGGCGAGRLYCAIQPNGIVTPCVYIPTELGSLRERKFTDIWENSRVLEELRTRENLLGHCGGCEFKNVCGGCRARAYAYYGNINGGDPGCIRNSIFTSDFQSGAAASVCL
jgi:radical SAM protein with 4Fe4S-binding SPASM domain